MRWSMVFERKRKRFPFLSLVPEASSHLSFSLGSSLMRMRFFLFVFHLVDDGLRSPSCRLSISRHFGKSSSLSLSLSLSLSFVIVFFCLPNRSFLLFVVSFSSRFAIDSPIVWRWSFSPRKCRSSWRFYPETSSSGLWIWSHQTTTFWWFRRIVFSFAIEKQILLSILSVPSLRTAPFFLRSVSFPFGFRCEKKKTKSVARPTNVSRSRRTVDVRWSEVLQLKLPEKNPKKRRTVGCLVWLRFRFRFNPKCGGSAWELVADFRWNEKPEMFLF